MKHAVIYARYSSDKQNEMSIEGQIQECKRYAKEHGFVVIGQYIDRAQTATTDKRPDFLRMISDSEDGVFDIIIVYQLDRFARNKNDSGYYKKILADNGVRVVSAIEQIASDASGIITEGMLEIVADWFSKQLSEKVNRGMRLRAEQTKHNGSRILLGYDIDQESRYIVDPLRAPIVQEIFRRVADGDRDKTIVDDLASRGVKTADGRPIGANMLRGMLRNERYKGIYRYGDVRIIDGMPRIISDEVYEEVQTVLEQRKKNRGHRPAMEDYLLTGKLYCGHCKTPMVGKSGTSKSGKIHRYYICKNAPRKCDKKNVRKDFIEQFVVEKCQRLISDDIIEQTVKAILHLNKQDQESAEILRLRYDIKDTEKKIDALVDQIESGVTSSRVIERLNKREEELDILQRQLVLEQAKQRTVEPDEAREFLESIRDGEVTDPKYQHVLIKVFIDRIYLYDDKVRILLNYSGKKGKAGKKKAEEIECALRGGVFANIFLWGTIMKDRMNVEISMCKRSFVMHGIGR